ncbi:MAG: septal ring lytic transglycosylase RlpA family protein [Cyanobacteria bacterium]|nr:septal ring lytic transglycosylase RlpA family protein [Cyanobacteriota bacterium]
MVPDTYIKYADAIANGSHPASAASSDCFTGPASWYGDDFHGRKTSAGDRYDMNAMTAAHRTLPFGTQLLVSNRKTGKSCIVKVNDRGPYHGNRVIDLSMGAARKLNMISAGVGVVDCFVLGVQ